MAFLRPFDPMNDHVDAVALALYCSELDTQELVVPYGARMNTPGIRPELVISLRASALLILDDQPPVKA